MGDEAEMPKYKCHKIVHGLKIADVMWNGNGSVDLFFEPVDTEEPGEVFSPINIETPDSRRFESTSPEDWGYYVVYDDGYVSWSPTKKFEDGYTRIYGDGLLTETYVPAVLGLRFVEKTVEVADVSIGSDFVKLKLMRILQVLHTDGWQDVPLCDVKTGRVVS